MHVHKSVIRELVAQITIEDVNLLHKRTLWPQNHSELITTFDVAEEKDFEINIFVRPLLILLPRIRHH